MPGRSRGSSWPGPRRPASTPSYWVGALSGALSTGMDRNVHPTHLNQLGPPQTYAVLDEYLEQGDPFDGHPLNGVP
jgi:hypothetical protein